MKCVDDAYRRACGEPDPAKAAELMRQVRVLREEIARTYGSISGLIPDQRQIELRL